MDKWTRLSVLVLLALSLTVGFETYRVLATPSPSINRVVTPGAIGPCTWFVSLDGTTPVAEAMLGGLSVAPGDNVVGTAGQDPAAFIQSLVVSKETICIGPGTYTTTSALLLAGTPGNGITDFTLRGFGRYATTFKTTTASGGLIALNNGNSADARITIEDMTVDQATTGASGPTNIVMSDGSMTDFTLSNVHLVEEGSTGTEATLMNISPHANGSVDRFSIINSFLENTASQQNGGLLLRGTWDVIVNNNVFRNVNNPITPDAQSGKKGLIYMNNLEDYDLTGFNIEGPDIQSWDNVVIQGNVQRIISNYVPSANIGGLLVDTATAGQLFGSHNWTITGNIYMHNPIQVVPRTGAGNSVTNVIIAHNIVNIACPVSTPNINIFDDPNSASANLTITGNIFANLCGVVIRAAATGWSRIVATLNTGYNPQPISSVTAGASPFTTATFIYPVQLQITTLAGMTGWTCRGDTMINAVNQLSPVLNPGQSCILTWTTTAPVFEVLPQ